MIRIENTMSTLMRVWRISRNITT